MKDDDNLPVSTPTSTSGVPLKKDSSSAAIVAAVDHSSLCFGRGRYKFWALGAILLLAFWSMLTGTVTLRLSAANLNHLSNRDSFDSPLPDDLDALELEEREMLVKHMWDVYTSNNRRIRLVKFWQNAFEAAYEDLNSDEPDIREAAFSEIAKMSYRNIPFEAPPDFHSLRIRRLSRKLPTGS